jgi:decaprenyl-phosphate phosphoribosyltransferase
VLGAIWKTLRPQQWVKNVLVVAAPLAAGVVTTEAVIGGTIVAFVTFCLMASAVYCLNDVVDAKADRNHPVKRDRPIAAGQLDLTVAITVAAVLAAASIGLALAMDTHQLWIVLVTYLAVSVTYALWLKHEQVVELALVSSGFLLRAIAGGVAVALPLSRWFLIVASFGSLLIVAGKRLSELLLVGAGRSESRKILASYSPTFLRMLLALSGGVACAAYCLWAFEISTVHGGVLWPVVSVAPFVVGMLRYMLDADAGRAEQPELILYRDRMLQLLGVIWLVTFAIGAVRG